MVSTRDEQAPAGGSPVSLPLGALHLWVLCAFAIAQPLFDVVQRDAEIFVAHRARPLDVVTVSLAILVLPPLVLVAFEALASLWSARLRARVHVLTVAALVALFALPPLARAVGSNGYLALALAGLAAAAGTWAYVRWRPARTLLSVLAPAPLVFALLFLFHSPVATLVRPASEAPPAAVDVGAPATVVFLLLDELPLTSLVNKDFEIDPVLFPNFARLARESTWFRNATASHGQTTSVVPAILTGRSPSGQDLLPVASDHPRSLFTLLGGSYRMRVRETVTSLCPTALGGAVMLDEPFGVRVGELAVDLATVFGHVALPDPLAAHLPPVTQNWRFAEFKRRKKPLDKAAVLRDFLGWIDDEKEPTLYFLHVLLPHPPWTFLPSGTRYEALTNVPGELNGVWPDDEAASALALQRHLLQLGYTDVLLGELLDQLRATGVYDGALLIVMADHGASFRPGTSKRTPAEENARDILHAPLFVKEPFQNEGRVNTRNVESIDILPTIADVLQVEIPWEVDGVSALDPGQPARPEKVIYAKRGERLVLPPELPETWPPLERRMQLFGREPRWSDVLRMAADLDLVGQAVGSLELTASTGLWAQLFGAERFETVAPDSGHVPCLVEGRIVAREDAPPPERIAIAVDGTIRAVTRTRERRPHRATFAALVPEDALRAGRNTIGIFALDAEGRCAAIPHLTYRLTGGGEPRIVDSDGQSFAVSPQAVLGSVDVADVQDDVLHLRGWAADAENRIPANTVVVFDGETVVFSGPTGYRIGGLGQRIGGRGLADYSGFAIRLPLSRLGPSAVSRLRVFALSGPRAAELPWSAAARQSQGR